MHLLNELSNNWPPTSLKSPFTNPNWLKVFITSTKIKRFFSDKNLFFPTVSVNLLCMYLRKDIRWMVRECSWIHIYSVKTCLESVNFCLRDVMESDKWKQINFNIKALVLNSTWLQIPTKCPHVQHKQNTADQYRVNSDCI